MTPLFEQLSPFSPTSSSTREVFDVIHSKLPFSPSHAMSHGTLFFGTGPPLYPPALGSGGGMGEQVGTADNAEI